MADKRIATKPDTETRRLEAMLVKDRGLLRSQLEEVREKYPLVALAYRIQQARVTELVEPTLTAEADLASFHNIIESGDTYASTEAVVDLTRRHTELFRCLERAESYTDGLGCFEGFLAKDR